MNTPIYLDHNATTPPWPEVVDEMVDVLQRAWANPSSMHAAGQAARRVLADARLRVAGFLGCQPSEVVFTSGATEANHMAVSGALAAHGSGTRRRLALSAVEHPALMQLAERLRARRTSVDVIPVDSQGRLDLDAANRLVGPATALVSVMGANNETGVLMPVEGLAALARERGAWLHVDATQLAGKAPLDFARSGADLMSVSAHKLGGPKGVGALIVRKGLALPALLPGRQERHRRGGTENLPAIAGFAAACTRAARTLQHEVAQMASLRRQLERGLRDSLPGVVIAGEHAERLCNTTCLRFGALDAEVVLSRLERAGLQLSSGAACSAGGTQPSHVMLAMGDTPLHARAAVRFSLGPTTTEADVHRAVQAAASALGPLLQPAPSPALPG